MGRYSLHHVIFWTNHVLSKLHAHAINSLPYFLAKDFYLISIIFLCKKVKNKDILNPNLELCNSHIHVTIFIKLQFQFLLPFPDLNHPKHRMHPHTIMVRIYHIRHIYRNNIMICFSFFLDVSLLFQQLLLCYLIIPLQYLIQFLFILQQ